MQTPGSKAPSGAPPAPTSSSYQAPEEAAKQQKSLILRVVRFAFFTLMVTFTMLSILRARQDPESLLLAAEYWVYLIAAVLLFGVVLMVDLLTPNKKISTLLGLMVGLLAGLLASLAFGLVIDLVLESWVPNSGAMEKLVPVVNTIKVLMGIALCYLGITTVLQTQDDFRIAIPYVEFVKQLRGVRPLLLDTSSLIDARIVDIAGTNLIQSPIIIPGFVIQELQTLADSGDALKRARGRRGLDVVARLQRTGGLDISIDETRVEGLGVDAQLVDLAQRFQGMIVTSDLALGRIAGIKQVPVLNLNDLATALKPNVIPGEQLTLKIVKRGEQAGQGVGYLPDGTMVVAEDGFAAIGQTVTLTVGSTMQTSAGRLVFGRVGFVGGPAAGGPAAVSNGTSQVASAAASLTGASVPMENGVVDQSESFPSEEHTDGEHVPDKAADANSDPAPESSTRPAGGATPPPPRTPFPPRPPRSIRSGTPRNPRR
jgi:uncharacterized protein YacL